MNFHTYLFDFAASIPVRIRTGDIFMAPDTQTIDFNATFFTLDLPLVTATDSSFGPFDDAGCETLSAATKRSDLDEEDDEDEEDEDDDEYEDDEDSEEEEEDDDEYEDDEDEEEDDEESDDDLDDEEDEDPDDDEDEDGEPKIIKRR